MTINEIKKASATEVLAEIKQANTLAEYQQNKVLKSVAEIKKSHEMKIERAAQAGNFELFSLLNQDQREEFYG